MKTEILGIGIDVLTKKEALLKAMNFIAANERKCSMIITPNPEVVMVARRDTELKNIISAADLVVPDGVGLVWASKYANLRLKETVPGCDLCYDVLGQIKDKSVFLLGGKPGVGELAAKNLKEKFPGINISGVQHGYFEAEGEESIVNKIVNLAPDVLLVGFGVPRQEKWIYKYKDRLPVNFAIGCGGTIDVMAGTVKRAPVIFRKLGLEWLYRLISQPSRFFRMLILPKFVIAVLYNYAKGGLN